MDTFAVGLACVRCGARYPLLARAACAACLTGLDAPSIEDSSLSQTLAVGYDLDAVRRSLDRDRLRSRPPGLWKWAELLPVADPACRIDVGAGGTRLSPLARLDRDLPVRLLAKVEGQNPSGSFKDRPIGVAASAIEHSMDFASIEYAQESDGKVAAFRCRGQQRRAVSSALSPLVRWGFLCW